MKRELIQTFANTQIHSVTSFVVIRTSAKTHTHIPIQEQS